MFQPFAGIFFGFLCVCAIVYPQCCIRQACVSEPAIGLCQDVDGRRLIMHQFPAAGSSSLRIFRMVRGSSVFQ